jgi:hypothetical protein
MAEDIILLPTKYDYGCGDNYPLDMMTFYKNDLDLKIIRNVNDFEYGLSKPRINREIYMRIFVRDPKKLDDARKAFKKFCKKIDGTLLKDRKESNH